MEFKDYYRILGVPDTADEKEIKASYRRLARKYHPDVSKERDAENRFKELGEAYEVLKDPDKRARYDQLRKLGAQQPDGGFRPPPGWQSAGDSCEGGFSGDDATLANAYAAFIDAPVAEVEAWPTTARSRPVA